MSARRKDSRRSRPLTKTVQQTRAAVREVDDALGEARAMYDRICDLGRRKGLNRAFQAASALSQEDAAAIVFALVVAEVEAPAKGTSETKT
jgi:hypothetical protein